MFLCHSTFSTFATFLKRNNIVNKRNNNVYSHILADNNLVVDVSASFQVAKTGSESIVCNHSKHCGLSKIGWCDIAENALFCTVLVETEITMTH